MEDNNLFDEELPGKDNYTFKIKLTKKAFGAADILYPRYELEFLNKWKLYKFKYLRFIFRKLGFKIKFWSTDEEPEVPDEPFIHIIKKKS